MGNHIATDGGENWGQGSTPPSEEIPEMMADKTGRDVTELPPLFDVVDPDALNDLFKNRNSGSVRFDYCGYEVTVTQTGKIVIEDG